MRENWLSNRVSGAYDNIVVAVDDARRKLLAMPSAITSIGMRQGG